MLKGSSAEAPSVAVLADGQPPSGWVVIPGMGHDSCLMCTLKGHLANEPGASGPVGGESPAVPVKTPHLLGEVCVVMQCTTCCVHLGRCALSLSSP